MYLLVLLFPLLNFLLVISFGRFIGNNGSKYLIILNMFFNFLISYFIFFEVILKGSICFFKIFSWFNIGAFSIH